VIDWLVYLVLRTYTRMLCVHGSDSWWLYLVDSTIRVRWQLQ